MIFDGINQLAAICEGVTVMCHAGATCGRGLIMNALLLHAWSIQSTVRKDSAVRKVQPRACKTILITIMAIIIIIITNIIIIEVVRMGNLSYWIFAL